MKYSLSAVLLSGVLLAAPVSQLFANDAGTPVMGEKGHQWDSKKMQKDLALTDDQVTQLDKLHSDEKTAMKPLMDKQKDLNKKLKDQVKNKAADADIKATMDDLKANRQAMMDQGKGFRDQREAILTPTQRAKMMLKRQHQMKKMRHEMHDKTEDTSSK